MDIYITAADQVPTVTQRWEPREVTRQADRPNYSIMLRQPDPFIQKQQKNINNTSSPPFKKSVNISTISNTNTLWYLQTSTLLPKLQAKTLQDSQMTWKMWNRELNIHVVSLQRLNILRLFASLSIHFTVHVNGINELIRGQIM